MLFHGPQKQSSISGGVGQVPTNVILSLSYLYFSHQSEKKIVGTCGGLTNHPYVRKSTRDTPLDAAGTTGVGRRGTIGAILSPIVDKNSMGPPVVATLIHENPGIPQVTS